MTGIAQEAAAVGEHTHETAQQAEGAQGIHLTRHTVELVVEPPAAAKLDLAGLGAVLEVAEHRGDDLVGTRIETIEDCTRELVLHIQFVEEMTHGPGCIELTDRVEAGVGSELVIHQRVIVTDSAIVILLRPVGSIVHLGTSLQESRLVLAYLLVGELHATQGLGEDRLDLGIRIRIIIELLNTVVREAAAILVEEVMTLLEGIYHFLERRDANSAHLREFAHVVGKVRLLDIHGFVRTPSGDHLNLETALSRHLMPVEVIDGIIGRADTLHMIAAHEATGAVLGEFQFLVALIIDLPGRLRREELRDTEGGLQFQMRPVIQRVPEGIRDGLSPFLKFLPVRRLRTRTIFLRHAIGTHGTPFIMVPAEPELRNALEMVIGGNHLGDEVAMVIDNRHLRCVIMIQILCGSCIKQEVFVHELFHCILFLLECFDNLSK